MSWKGTTIGELEGDYYGGVGRGLLWGSWQVTILAELAGDYYGRVGRELL